jgi:hypothetical protein
MAFKWKPFLCGLPFVLLGSVLMGMSVDNWTDSVLLMVGLGMFMVADSIREFMS